MKKVVKEIIAETFWVDLGGGWYSIYEYYISDDAPKRIGSLEDLPGCDPVVDAPPAPDIAADTVDEGTSEQEIIR